MTRWPPRCGYLFLLFGYNESFAGEAGVEAFKTDYLKFSRRSRPNIPAMTPRPRPWSVVISPVAPN